MGKFFPNQDQDSKKVPSCSLSMIYSWSLDSEQLLSGSRF